MRKTVLDYDKPRREPVDVFRWFVLLTPLWCFIPIGIRWFYGFEIDLYLSTEFAVLLTLVCLSQGRRGLALYCICVLVILVLFATIAFQLLN